MALVSHPRASADQERSALSARRGRTGLPRRRRRGWYAVGGALLVLLALVGVGVIVFASARASLTADSNALAKVGLPLGGGSIQSVTVVTGPHSRRIPVYVRGQQIWPRGLIPAHKRLTIDVAIKRPGWISWLAGKTDRLRLSLVTPFASLRQHYLTLAAGAPLRLAFNAADQGALLRAAGPDSPSRARCSANRGLAGPRRRRRARSLWRRLPRSWETATASLVSWFPAGAKAAAVALPAPVRRSCRARRSP